MDNGGYEVSYVYIGKIRFRAVGQTANYSEFPLPGGSVLSQGGGDTGVQLADWLGTIRAWFSYTGGTEGLSGAHAPFGEAYAYASGSPQSFTGQLNDGTMGNTTYYFPERQYRSSQGRWLSPDPAGLSAADPTNPQTWNRYAYVLNNPLRYTDPNGLWCVWEDGTYDEDPNSRSAPPNVDQQGDGDPGGDTGGDNQAQCTAAGGHWDAYDTITGILQDGNGNVTQITYAANGTNYTCTSADCGAGGTLQQFDQTLQGYSQGPPPGQSLNLYLLSLDLRNTTPGPVPTAFLTRPTGPPGPPSSRFTQTQWDAMCDYKTGQWGGFEADEAHVPESGVSVYTQQGPPVVKDPTLNPSTTSAGAGAQAGGAGLAIVTGRGTTSATCKAAYH